MMKGKQNLKDGLFVVTTLVIAYLTNLWVRRTLHTQSLAPMIFVLGVFLISLRIRMLSGENGENFGSVYQIDDLTIDCERRIGTIGNSEVKLTQTEFNILTLLAQHRGKMMTYSTIIRRIWGSMDEGSVKKLQVNMANIRKKLGIKPGDNRYFINELGVGYRMLEE